MRHKVAGLKLGRNTAHRRALLRNLVTSVIVEERIETTVTKAKAVRPHVEKMITLGKRGDVAARRLAACLPHDRRSGREAVRHRRPALRRSPGRLPAHHPSGFQKGDGADKAFVELLGSEAVRREAQKRAEARARSAPPKPRRRWKRRRPRPRTTAVSSQRKKTRKKSRIALPGQRGTALGRAFFFCVAQSGRILCQSRVRPR